MKMSFVGMAALAQVELEMTRESITGSVSKHRAAGMDSSA
ncbi:hypothetical protein ACH61_01177 [Rathayibacter tanaceti]|uniref:Uncharacterized protein n=1 Tax=Rathayibacter tanaceti TaxID=1671680 RepID=A0A162GIF0_9MICO|nr:hypothetical protein ACH61_01177 [Rathayibacter tanaceti]